jgi:SNF2 family DNA or RNA helicase
VDAQVDLNPHQIDAALFAFRSPLSKGALLADEVGLGKTIEAGLVLSQKWAERKRRILVIVPSNLRTQWYQELPAGAHGIEVLAGDIALRLARTLRLSRQGPHVSISLAA